MRQRCCLEIADGRRTRPHNRRGQRFLVPVVMLHLLGTPHWSNAERSSDLPHTLPGWTISFLAMKRDWVSRDHLCALLWPDAAATEAQHNLRVNLYRSRALLQSLGIAGALEVERKRVRLPLPTDVTELRQALAATHGSGSAAVDDADDNCANDLLKYGEPLLPGMSFPGFPALEEWAQLERATLQRQWREAALARLCADRLPTSQAMALCTILMTADPLDDEALSHQLRHLAELGRASDARRLFQQFRDRLRETLGVEPPLALATLAARLIGTTTSNPAAAAALASAGREVFVGREMELAQLQAMLCTEGSHIVTLVGPGGVGKSRIARELGKRLAGRWRDGVAWVALADLSDAAAASLRLAEQIGLTLAPQRDALPQVTAALALRQSLIVLDNAEHLDGLAPLLTELQRASPGSTWLVTSRAPLALPAERSYTLEGMDSPAADSVPADVEQAMAFDAMRLLDLRTRALLADFDIAAHWMPCLELVRATGGWPLAIELAAAAVAQHGVAAVVADLKQSIDALAAGSAPRQARHDSMRASLDLSWRLLGLGPSLSREQIALAGLSVFRGGFTRTAALTVTRCSGVALAQLIDRTLVHVVGNGRFDLHPLVGQFAAEKLAEHPAHRLHATRAHAEHYAGRLQACAAAGASAGLAMLDEIGADFENFRSAWTTLIAHGDTSRIAGSAAAWSEFGTARGRVRELTTLVAAALSAIASAPNTAADATASCALLQAAAILHFRGGELDSAEALARDALAAAKALGDEAGQRAMLNTLAFALKDLGRYAEAEQCAQAGLHSARATGAEREVAAHANTCAILAKTRGDQAGAAALYAEAIAIHRRSANHRSLALCLNNLGNVHRALDDMVTAQGCFEESLRVAEQHDIGSTRAFALVNLGLVQHRCGKPALALSYAQRARAEPAAEVGVLLAADALEVMAAIEQQAFSRAHEALRAFAHRARQTGLHAALLESVNCHAKLLAATGQRDAAIARFAFLVDHRQLPAIQRTDAMRSLQGLAPTSAEQARAEASASRFDLDLLIEDAAASALAPA